METPCLNEIVPDLRVKPACPVFGFCGGCSYQDLPYEQELKIKERALRDLFRAGLPLEEGVFEPIVASPAEYHYRNRLDLTFKKVKQDRWLFGFQKADTRQMISVDACPIAREEISAAIPACREQAQARLLPKYRTANLVMRTGDSGRVLWGGIGRRSLEVKEGDYFYTDIRGKRIFYSLDTFFQANLSILPSLVDRIERLADFDSTEIFFDLYAGVGLFGIYFANRVKGVVMIEENIPSLKLMRYNMAQNGLERADIFAGKVEEGLPAFMSARKDCQSIGIIDPPRKGLSASVCQTLGGEKRFAKLFYLSCNPESLVLDLVRFAGQGWRIERVIPFDFFPKTSHLETLVLLKPQRS